MPAAWSGLGGAYFAFAHVRERVDGFLDPAAGDNYQVDRSLEAFMNGGLIGRGPGEGTVKAVLPDAHSDFIFAVAGEEFGLLLCLLLVALFAFIVLRGFARLLHENNLFVLLATSGLLVTFGLQAVVNMASTLHLMPTKGMTLPFISYGGSSLLALSLAMGMVLALTRRRAGPRRRDMSAPRGRGVIALAAGGTGGHMFPAEALAGELLARGHGVALVTDRRGGGFGERLPGGRDPSHRRRRPGRHRHRRPRARRRAARRRLLPGSRTDGAPQAVRRRRLRRLRVGSDRTGGEPLGIPTALHEQNAVLGRANRLLAKRATRIATSFASVVGIGTGDRAVLTGNPVRPGIAALADQPYPPLSAGGAIQILVVGGSQGARVFSRLIPEAVALLPADLQRRLRIAQQARAEDLETARANYAKLPAAVELAPFFGDMPERLRAAHLVVCRSGASTVAELTAAGRPAILIPYPFATDDHQTANARALDTAGAAWLMPEAATTPAMLADRLAALAADPERLGRAADVARALGRRDAAARLADLVTSLIRGNGARKEAA